MSENSKIYLTIIDRLNKLIDDNLNNSNFTVESICSELGQSRSQLFRLVKEHSQLSISLYIRQRKLAKAKELLDNSDLKIAEITYQIGIDSPQSFSKYFTETYGLSPTEYRKNRAKEGETNPSNTIDNEIIAEIVGPKITNLSKWIWAIPILLLSLITTYFFQKNDSTKNETSSIVNTDKSIAILPFKNLGKAENQLFSDGLMSQVHSALAIIEELKLISKNSSLLFKDTKKTIPQIANELKVNYILDGTVIQNGKQILVNVELVKASEDKVLWTKNFNGNTKEVLQFMNQVAIEIAKMLNQKLSIDQSKQITKIPTENLEAYQAYLKGLELLKSRTKDKMEAGIIEFDKAIELDPNFADAFAAKASAYFILGNFKFMELQASIKFAEQNALAAIRLDSNNGTSYAILAGVYKLQFKWEQAITTYQIALKHSPNDAQINYWYGITLRSVGEMSQAIKYNAKAVSLDPLYPVILVGLIGSYSYAEEFELAEKAIKSGKLIFDKDYMYFYSKAMYYLIKKDYKSAINECKKSDSLYKYFKNNTLIAYCETKLGNKNSAVEFLKNTTKTPENYLEIAIVYESLGDKENAFKYLKMAADKGLMLDYFMITPYFKSLHSDKRFDELLNRFGLNVKLDLE